MSKLDVAYQRLDARVKAMSAFGLDVPRNMRERMMRGRGQRSHVKWQKDGLAYCYPEWPHSHGLHNLGIRKVGCVIPEFRRHDWSWAPGAVLRNKGRHYMGWHTNEDGDVMQDGEGLCWGIVYQLPGRKQMTRLVAGYVFGGNEEDAFPTIDFGNVFEYRVRDGELFDYAVDCARRADNLAKDAAEEECEHQRKYREEYNEEAA